MTVKNTPVLVIVFLLTFMVHEAAHWGAGELLGYDMEVSINSARPVSGDPSGLEATLISAAGPVITFIQAIIALLLLQQTGARLWFMILFSAFFMRLMAFGVSFLNYNDEARISVYLGWPWWLLPVIVVAVLLLMLVQGSSKSGVGWRSWLLAWIVLSAGAAGIILTEPYWPVLS